MNEKKTFCCVSRDLANFMIKNGLAVKKIDADRYNPERSVFLFDYCPEIEECLTQWRQNKFRRAEEKKAAKIAEEEEHLVHED